MIAGQTQTRLAVMNNNNRLVPALAGILLSATAIAQEEEASWDVGAPPGTPRTIGIDTDSGTWMSLDVSPDGRSIAFDLLGDIYVLPIGGGEARAIHSGLSWSMQPRFSPDGSEIAFTSDAGGADNIWIADSDGGNARQLTQEDFRTLNNPFWSPDGNYLGAQAFHDGSLARHRRNLDLPQERRQRRPGRRKTRRGFPEGSGGTGLFARRPLHLFQRRQHAGRHVHLCAGLE